MYLSWLGPQGLREVGETCLALSKYAKERLDLPLVFPDQTTFKEFAVRVGRPAQEAIAAARATGVHPGYALGATTRRWRTRCSSASPRRRRQADIDRLAEVLAA